MSTVFCKDCIHSIQDGSATWWLCRKDVQQSPVNGITFYGQCSMMRVDSRCGPEGLLFEPHPDLVDQEPPDQYNRPADQESQL